MGKPLATSEERAEHIGPIAGIPVFGLDALSSAAYGPEAALTLLIPLGAAGIAHIVPISFAIIALLAICLLYTSTQRVSIEPDIGSCGGATMGTGCPCEAITRHAPTAMTRRSVPTKR